MTIELAARSRGRSAHYCQPPAWWLNRLAMLSILALSMPAADRHWVGDVSSDWADGANWQELGSISTGAIRSSSEDSLDLGIANQGSSALRLLVACTASTPSNWQPAAVASSNAFLVKADTAPLDPLDPADYAVLVSTVDTPIVSLVRTGRSTNLNFLFQSPTAISIGGGIPQQISIVLTAEMIP